MKPQQKQTQVVGRKDVATLKPSGEIVKREPATLAEVPEYLRRAPGQPQAGFEEVEQGDLTVPQMRLCQSLTPQRQEGEPKYIKSLREGEYFNTVTGENYGKLVQIVPLMFFKNRIRFRDKNEGGGILCRSDDMRTGIGDPGGACVTCQYNQFGSAKNGKGKGKACTEFYNFPALVVPEDGSVSPDSIVVRSFKSSGVPVAKDWLAMMRLRGIDMYGGVYEITSASKKFAEGTSYIEVVKPAGNVNKEGYEVAQRVFTMFAEMRRQGKIKIDQDDEAVDEPGASDESNS
jgi:hypothetical protein